MNDRSFLWVLKILIKLNRFPDWFESTLFTNAWTSSIGWSRSALSIPLNCKAICRKNTFYNQEIIFESYSRKTNFSIFMTSLDKDLIEHPYNVWLTVPKTFCGLYTDQTAWMIGLIWIYSFNKCTMVGLRTEILIYSITFFNAFPNTINLHQKTLKLSSLKYRKSLWMIVIIE